MAESSKWNFSGASITVKGNFVGENHGTMTTNNNTENNAQTAIEDLKILKPSLKTTYGKAFRRIRPFSLSFTLDIENTWVPLTLFDRELGLKRTVNHSLLLKETFAGGINKLLIIEGAAATGKTCLMRRIAYDWATGDKFLSEHYDIVLLVEFRNIHNFRCKKITELIIAGQRAAGILNERELQLIEALLNSKSECASPKMLLLLDGFDEAHPKDQCEDPKDPKDQCEELNRVLTADLPPMHPFDIVITSRPGHTTRMNGCRAEVLGFDTDPQKHAYIDAHFHVGNNADQEKIEDAERQKKSVRERLSKSYNLQRLAETPLFLCFICLVHDRIKTGSLFDLYCNIIEYLLNRYQKEHVQVNLPEELGFKYTNNSDKENWRIIQDHWFEFPLLQKLGEMAYEMIASKKFVFEKQDIENYGLNTRVTPESSQFLVEATSLLRKEDEIDENGRNVVKFVFPHRSIQEFLAGGIFYLWPNSRTSSSFQRLSSYFFGEKENPLFEEIFSKPKRYMNDVEKFIWRAAIGASQPLHMNNALSAFKNYATELLLDVSFILESGNTADHLDCGNLLTKLSSNCTNLRHLVLDNIQRESKISFLIIQSTLDLSSLKLLNTFTMGWISPKFERFCNFHSHSGTTVLKLPVSKSVREIKLRSCLFAHSETFLATLRHCLENMYSDRAMLELENVTIKMETETGLSCISVCRALSEFRADHAHEPNTEFGKILHHFTFADNIIIRESEEECSQNQNSDTGKLLMMEFQSNDNSLEDYDKYLEFKFCTFEPKKWRSILHELGNNYDRIRNQLQQIKLVGVRFNSRQHIQELFQMVAEELPFVQSFVIRFERTLEYGKIIAYVDITKELLNFMRPNFEQLIIEQLDLCGTTYAADRNRLKEKAEKLKIKIDINIETVQ